MARRRKLTPEQQAVQAAADRSLTRRPIADAKFVREAADRADRLKVPSSETRKRRR
jgi:hypothetical protein